MLRQTTKSVKKMMVSHATPHIKNVFNSAISMSEHQMDIKVMFDHIMDIINIVHFFPLKKCFLSIHLKVSTHVWMHKDTQTILS